MSEARSALTPDALAMMDAIARSGSFAAAARQLGKVPSALTYSVRQLEEALDVLLFDRRSRQATLTAAGQELLDEGRRLLEEIEAVANRVKRVATGWETQLTIAVDDVISRTTLLELCESFYACSATLARTGARGAPSAAATPPATRLRLRTEVLAGTWEALVTGQADLAIGVGTHRELPSGVTLKDLGPMPFVFAVAPHHPLAAATEPIAPGARASDWVWMQPAIKDSLAYYADFGGNVYVLNITTGKATALGEVAAKVKSSPVVVGDVLVVADRARNVTFFNIKEAKKLNTVPAGDSGTFRAGLTVANELVYAVTTKGALFRANPKELSVVEIPIVGGAK